MSLTENAVPPSIYSKNKTLCVSAVDPNKEPSACTTRAFALPDLLITVPMKSSCPTTDGKETFPYFTRFSLI